MRSRQDVSIFQRERIGPTSREPQTRKRELPSRKGAKASPRSSGPFFLRSLFSSSAVTTRGPTPGPREAARITNKYGVCANDTNQWPHREWDYRRGAVHNTYLELSAIKSRLERVENENRKLKTAGVVALIMSGTIFLMGQTQTNRTLEVQRLVLKGPDGTTRALLDVVKDNAELTLYGPQGGKQPGIVTAIGASPEGSFILLGDRKSRSKAYLEVMSSVPKLHLLIRMAK